MHMCHYMLQTSTVCYHSLAVTREVHYSLSEEQDLGSVLMTSQSMWMVFHVGLSHTMPAT